MIIIADTGCRRTNKVATTSAVAENRIFPTLNELRLSLLLLPLPLSRKSLSCLLTATVNVCCLPYVADAKASNIISTSKSSVSILATRSIAFLPTTKDLNRKKVQSETFSANLESIFRYGLVSPCPCRRCRLPAEEMSSILFFPSQTSIAPFVPWYARLHTESYFLYLLTSSSYEGNKMKN